MTDFHEILAQTSVDDLKIRIRYLDTNPIEKPTRKAQFIKLIESQLRGDTLKRHYQRLDKYGQAAISEVVHGTSKHFNGQTFSAKYGTKALRSVINKNYDPVRCLNLFLYRPNRHAWRQLVLPEDLRQRLLEFVPQPTAAKLQTKTQLSEMFEVPARKYQKEIPSQVELRQRTLEFESQHDLLSVLQLVETGVLGVTPKTQKPTAASVKRIQKILSSEEYYVQEDLHRGRYDEEIGPIRAYAWLLLLQSAKMIRNRGNKVELTKAGHSARSVESVDSIRLIWRSWIMNKSVDEFSRVNAVKGQTGKGKRYMTNPAYRRIQIVDGLRDCPVGKWVHFDEFSRYLRAMDLSFEVTENPWSLYISHVEYGNLGYDGYHGWNLLQGRYILCLLFEYAATLGMIDVAYVDPKISRNDFLDMWFSDELSFFSRYDGLQYFRLNPLGAYCLGLTDTYKQIVPKVEGSLSVQPSLIVRASDNFPHRDKLFLEIFAEKESENIWRLDSDKTLSALSSGRKIDDLQKFLEARDEQILPDRVTGFLNQVKRRSEAIKLQGMALVIECANAETANQLIADKQVNKYCELAGERKILVPTASEDKFRRAVRKMGYIVPNN